MTGLYARQSVKKDNSASLDTQLNDCRMRVPQNDEIKEYKDEGYSGKNTQRPGLERLMSDVEKGVIDCIIVYKLDRFSRSILDFFEMSKILEAHNCRFISVCDNLDTKNDNWKLWASILSAFAEMERDNIIQRVTDNYYYRTGMNGTWGSGLAPFGYRNHTTEDGEKTIVPVEEEIEIVKLMYSLYNDSKERSLSKVAEELREKGYKTKTGNTKWTSCTISKTLQNTIYTVADRKLYNYLASLQVKFLNDKSEWDGSKVCQVVARYKGCKTKDEDGKEIIKRANLVGNNTLKEQSVYLLNGVKGVIKSEEYIRAVERLKGNKCFSNVTKATRLQELSGKLKCGSCGYAIRAYGKSTNGRPYLDCYNNRIGKECTCRYNKFNFYDIQDAVGQEVQNKINNFGKIKARKLKIKKEKRLGLETLKEKKENIKELLYLTKTEETREEFLEDLEEINVKIAKLENDIARDFDYFDDLPKCIGIDYDFDIPYTELPTETKKLIINAFIDKILLHEKTGKIEIIWNELE